MQPDTSYYYIVRPINAIGVGPKSPEVKGTSTKFISVKSLSFGAYNVLGGVNFTGTVAFTRPAPPSGELVRIDASNPDVLDFPRVIQVNEGATGCTFVVHPHPVTTPVYSRISVYCDSGSKDFYFTIYPHYATTVVSIKFLPSVVMSGDSVTAQLILNGPAPSANAVVQITSSNPAALYVPTTAQLNSGLVARDITAYALPVTDTTPVTVTATWGE